MPISAAYAQTAAAQTATGPGGLLGSLGAAGQFLPIVLIFGVFYFLLIRPQQQKAKELKTALNGIKRGDRVVTGGGIVGTVQMVRDNSNEIEVEIAPNVRVSVVRETINSIIQPVAANDRKAVKSA